MNLKLIGKFLGKIMVLEGLLMLFPFAISIIYQEYKENIKYPLAFLIPIAILIFLGLIFQRLNSTRKGLYQKEGFALCAIVWIIMTIFGAIPFVINGDIPNYIDALFETMSGFTTTGASILDDVEVLHNSSQFWRCFTHWIGGMGILVFILIFVHESSDGSSLHLLKAESPGPQVGKIASKMKVTSRILYLIYLILTLVEFGLLMFDKGNTVIVDGVERTYKMDWFSSLLISFGSAGTGGFGIVNKSMEYYSPYVQYVVATMLVIFGINFSLYYLIIIGKVKEVFKSEELKTYLFMIISAVIIIVVDRVFDTVSSFSALSFTTFELIFRQAYFQVASIITSAGYSSTDFNTWSTVCKSVIVILMLVGAMAGSTGGGIKQSRLVIALKGIKTKIKKLINPRYVANTTFENKNLDEDTINDVFLFCTLYFVITIIVTFILAFDTKSSNTLITNLTATISCMSNIGPGLGGVGPYSSFNVYNYFSKILLTLTMLIGRLEILPVLILFSKRTWKK